MTTRENFTPATSRPLIYEACIQYTEAATDDMGIFLGFSSDFAAVLLADTTSVPDTDMTAFGVYKRFNELAWRAFSSVGTLQNDTLSLESSQPSPTTTFQIVRVQVDVVGTNLEVTYHVGQVGWPGAGSNVGAAGVFPVGLQQLREAASGFGKPIKHRIPFSGAVKMGVGAYMKQLSATAETLVVDYIAAGNLRT